MKRNMLLLIEFIFISQFLHAQKKEIKSYSDLPAINYSTAVLKTADKVKIDAWIKNIAALELKHIDGLSQKYFITNISVQSSMVMRTLFCRFITAKWNYVKYADTIFRNWQQQMHPAFKKAGLSPLSSYAKAKLQQAPDFNKSYMQFFIEDMNLLSENEKEVYIGYIIKIYEDAPNAFEEDLKKITHKPFVADTSASMFSLLNNYVFIQANTGITEQLLAYLNKGIKDKFTRADTLRGSITPERAWWNVLHYGITIKPDFATKTIIGKNEVRYQVVNEDHPASMQIDLQEPLIIDSVLFNDSQKLNFTKDGNVWHITVPGQGKLSINSLVVYYHGIPHEAINPPWDGGWIWRKDSLGNPWMSAACQGIGASTWYPCKDIQSDEPDSGASLSMIVPDTLVGVANGKPYPKKNNNNGTVTYKWQVVNPINNYDIIPYIGKYVNISEVYMGEKGNLDINYWLLPYNAARARIHMFPEVHRMLKAFEYWFGPYPFYEDGYKLVDAPYEGMENQSDIAYGNGYQNGQEGYDASLVGWGMKWDLIIVHESAHEWFGNNITSNDIADMWVHEGFGNYSETLFTEYWYGIAAGNEYNVGTRHGIQNIFPVIGFYNVNDGIADRNGDMYPKGGNLLHAIRHSMNNDSLFREILRGLNTTFYHQTVTSLQVEKYISDHAGFDYSKVFDQYLRNTAIPQLEFYLSNDKKSITYRYTNCVEGFNLPLVLKSKTDSLIIFPEKKWKTSAITVKQSGLFDATMIEKMYYITAKKNSKK